MNGIEKTLRDTLAKLENPDSTTRQKLYDTTEAILRRSLEPFAQSKPEIVAERLQNLQDIIVILEQEYNLKVPLDDLIKDPSFSIPNVAPPITDTANSERSGAEPFVPQVEPDTSTASPEIHTDLHPLETPSISEPTVPWPESNVQAPTQNQSAPHVSVERSHIEVSEKSIDIDRPPSDTPDELKVEPVVAASSASDNKADRKLRKKERREKRRRRGSLLDLVAGSIVSVVFIIFLFGGIWLFSNSEYYQLFLDWRNGDNLENSEEQVADKDFIPKPLTSEGDQLDSWTEIFGYQDVENVRGRGEALVETIDDGGDGGVRITSVNSSEFGEAQIPLDTDKLKAATSQKFAIALSIFAESPTQIYVKCQLKNGIETDRRRFQLNGGLNNVMLEMDMTGVASFDPAPHIALNSDITGGGRSIDLYDVRYQIIE